MVAREAAAVLRISRDSSASTISALELCKVRSISGTMLYRRRLGSSVVVKTVHDDVDDTLTLSATPKICRLACANERGRC